MINDLIKKIMAEAEQKASVIKEQAEKDAQSLADAHLAQAKEETEFVWKQYLESSKVRRKESDMKKSMAIRNANLEARRQILDEVFIKAMDAADETAKQSMQNNRLSLEAEVSKILF
ncbi:MAG: hypothetical protein U9Q15_02050 [Patescibacteria group bacterium]|nr:hypothetical protein [Patescibacteria group bacterium]